MIAVFNTSPLIFLSKLNVIDPALRLFSEKNVRMVEALCRRLGRGESEAIVLAMEQSADFIILESEMKFRVKRDIFDEIFAA
ncbi:hypothetical protein M1O13_00665 [Dehalococcoidia bacterium]|nr:hypothetical protein [Dehalococcoidia bacterium]